MAYSEKLIDHYENPRNIGSFDKSSDDVGTGLVGAPACGDVMKLQIKVGADGLIEDAKFKTFGCGSAIASSSLVTEWVKGKTIDEAETIKNTDIARHLALPPVKIHCSVLAEDAIKAAIADYRAKTTKKDEAQQAAGKIALDVEAMNIDLMSISGHKIYGPKGIGALYVRRKPRVRLVPLIVGGGQERGFRSGTLPTPLCVGLGKAAEIAMNEMEGEAKRLAKLQARMLKGLQDRLPEIFVNGDLEHRIPGNLNISFAYVEGESLMMGIKNLAVSSGSACTSASLEPSYVLRALGVEEEMAHTSLRIGLGRFTTEHEVDTAVEELVRHVNKLREMSPLWEMAQEGIDIKSIEWAAH